MPRLCAFGGVPQGSCLPPPGGRDAALSAGIILTAGGQMISDGGTCACAWMLVMVRRGRGEGEKGKVRGRKEGSGCVKARTEEVRDVC